jgi:hypothetical protein
LTIVVTPSSPKEPEIVQDSCGSFVKPYQKFWLSPPTPRYVIHEAIPETSLVSELVIPEEEWSLEDEIEYENSISTIDSGDEEDDEIDYQIWKAEQWSDF